jgi:hypothetical protein
VGFPEKQDTCFRFLCTQSTWPTWKGSDGGPPQGRFVVTVDTGKNIKNNVHPKGEHCQIRKIVRMQSNKTCWS